MSFENYKAGIFYILKLLLPHMYLGPNMVDCTLPMDLVNSFASNGASCVVFITDVNAKDQVWTDMAKTSRISVTFYDTNSSPTQMSVSGKDCLHYLLMFNNVASTMQFLNRC